GSGLRRWPEALQLFPGVVNKRKQCAQGDSMGDRRHGPSAIACVLLSLGSGLGGCAFSYTDANGDRHAIGLVDITVRAPTSTALAGDVVEITSLGLSVGQN